MTSPPRASVASPLRSLLALLVFLSAAAAPALSVAAGVERAVEARAPAKADPGLHPVQALFNQRCGACHGPARQESGLRLDSLALARQGGDSGAGAVADKPDAGTIWQRVTSADPAKRMPPGGALTPDELKQVRGWLEAGAPAASATESRTVRSDHWALQPIRRPALPAVKRATWARNPVDRFILARLEREGLTPSGEADPYTLIRRVTLDLTGLPPEPEQVRAFAADPSQEAYERLVDRLLASPHYGEKWGRHWLDVARYADSNGFTIDSARSIWKYRDWVIDALNADMPYDRFIAEQLAGDLLPNASQSQLVATGFHRNTLINEEGGTDPEQFRVEAVVDRVATTGSAFLGLTVACAQCHTHKFDPITQREYYELFAFFNNQDEPQLTLASEEEKTREKQIAERLREATLEVTRLAKHAETSGSGSWRTVQPFSARTSSGAELQVLADGSTLAPADLEGGVYDVALPAPEGTFSTLRLDALTHDSLPNRGPGLAGGNFILADVRLRVESPAGEQRDLPLSGAVADHSQANYPVAHAVDGDPVSGWAINTTGMSGEKLNSDRSAVFVFEQPVTLAAGEKIHVRLTHRAQGRRYLLGRFKLSLSPGPIEDLPPLLTPRAREIAEREAGSRTPEEEKLLAQQRTANLPALAVPRTRQAKVQAELTAFRKKIPTTMILRERPEPRVTHIHLRGDFLRKGEVVAPATPAVLPKLKPRGVRADRLDLAQWLTAPQNPLTSRVAVNRVWQYYFGRGLVETENDFGTQGASPSHPDLLDWLADEFRRGSGSDRPWSQKALHRLIVTSSTYRQSSRTRSELAAKDPENRLLGRQTRLRVDAEQVRDLALAASGLLSRKVGGPSVFPPQPAGVDAFTQSKKNWTVSAGDDRYRRGLYTFSWRTSPYAFFAAFDAPNGTITCTRRGRSNTPVSALMMANDATIIEMAQALAAKLLKELPASTPLRIRELYIRALGRAPSEAELKMTTGFLHRQLSHYRTDARAARLAAGERLAGDPAEGAAWTSLCRAVMNLDEFITRE